MDGRKPKPAALTDAKKSKLNVKRVEQRKEAEKNLQTTSRLNCPNYLTKEAQKEWRRIMKLYRKMEVSILNDLDIPALVMYCEAVSIYKEAQSKWKEINKVVSTNRDSQKIIDKVKKTMDTESEVICKLAEQLCITPLGRARIGIASALKPKGPTLKDFMKDDD